MPKPPRWTAAYEHEEYGVAYVTFDWAAVDDDEMHWQPIVDYVEFDFWTPYDEQEELLWELRTFQHRSGGRLRTDHPTGLRSIPTPHPGDPDRRRKS